LPILNNQPWLRLALQLVPPPANVKEAIAKLALPHNSSGQYTHDDITTFIMGIRQVLKSTYNPSDPGNGMAKLLISSMATPPSLLSCIRLTDAVTIQSMLDNARAIAAATSMATVTVTPIITSCTNAHDKADRINQINQAVIGMKEGSPKPSPK
jgi:hypothetical protein